MTLTASRPTARMTCRPYAWFTPVSDADDVAQPAGVEGVVELLPCPFCGSVMVSFGVDNQTGKWAISCPDCPIFIAASSKESALLTWNTRRVGTRENQIHSTRKERHRFKRGGRVYDQMCGECNAVADASIHQMGDIERELARPTNAADLAERARRVAEQIVPDCLSRTCFIKDCSRTRCWGCDDSKTERQRVAGIIAAEFAGGDGQSDS